MSKADELLASIGEEATVHAHVVSDPDNYFIINPDTRVIENVSGEKNTLVQYDHNSEVYTFELPRYVEGHDMTLCNRVRVHFNNVDILTNQENTDVVELYDLAVNSKDKSTVIATWTVRREATQLAGILGFAVQYMCVAPDGEVTYEWHTDAYTDVEVKPGRNYSEAAVVQYSNILEQWYQKLFGLKDSLVADIAAESEKQKDAIALKGEETLASIPADYTETYSMAEEALRRKANAIELETNGTAIIVNDSSDAYLLGLKLYGRTIQKTTTGAQLAYTNVNVDYVYKGVLASVTEDGNILVSGTTTEEMWNRLATANLVAGETYTLSSNGALILTVWDATAGTSIATKERNVATMTFTAINTGVHTFVMSNTAHNVFTGIRADIMVNTGSVALPWEPYSAGMEAPCPEYPQSLMSVKNPTCTLYGVNMFPLREVTAVGVTGIPQPDGTVKYTGTADTNAWHAYQVCPILVDGTYTLSIETMNKTEKGSLIQIYDKNGLVGRSWQNVENHFSCTFDALAGSTVRWNIGVLPDETVDTTVKLMLNLGSVSLPWEPYACEQSVPVNRTLCGIPVASGGNFTDANGQQWICDEIDFERGVYVQRIGVRVVTGNASENWGAYNSADGEKVFHCYLVMTNYARRWPTTFCDRFRNVANVWERQEYGLFSDYNTSDLLYFSAPNAEVTDIDTWREWLSSNPTTLIYLLKTQIETSLTEEEIAYYKKLKTYYRNTTVMNSAGAPMAIKYAADTEIFVYNSQSKPTTEQVKSAVDAYLAENPVQAGMTESDLYNGVVMVDRITGKKYIVYIDNGKLTMAESGW